MPGKKVKNKKPSEKYKKYKVENGKIVKRSVSCPKCGPGIFLAEHKDRQTCGKCAYTQFKNQVKISDKPQKVI